MSDKPDNGQIVAFICGNIGQVDDGVRVEQRRNTDGSLYWCATTQITHVFGSEIQMDPLEAFGATPEQARGRLEKELKDFNDSLWV